MPLNSIAPISFTQSDLFLPATGGSHGKPTNVKEAATQFEGMLIGEMLRSVHDSNSGSLDGEEDSDAESDTTFSMAADQFAQLMAKQGGFGIAKLVTAGLTNVTGSAGAAKSGDGNHSDRNADGTAASPNPL